MAQEGEKVEKLDQQAALKDVDELLIRLKGKKALDEEGSTAREIARVGEKLQQVQGFLKRNVQLQEEIESLRQQVWVEKKETSQGKGEEGEQETKSVIESNGTKGQRASEGQAGGLLQELNNNLTEVVRIYATIAPSELSELSELSEVKDP